MVAAMLRTNENDNAAIGLRTTDLRNIAIGLAAAIALIMVSGHFADSGSASGSALEDTAEKRFANPTISITTIGGDGYINEDEADTNGFTVTGTTTNAVDNCDDEAGDDCIITVQVGGVSATNAVSSDGSYTVTFAANAISGVSDGTVQILADVTNDDGAATQAVAFATLDTADPVVSETTAVTTPTNDQTPDVVITSGEAGDLSYATCTFGSATASSIAASSATTLTLDSDSSGGSLAAATYANCAIRVTDAAGNIGSVTLTTFVVDTTAAAATETTAVTTPTNDQTPDVVINVAEAGTIAVGGTSGCDSSETAVASGANTITLDGNGAGGNMAEGTYTCTITFTDSAGNAASALTLTAFTVDVTVAAATESTAVTTPTKDQTPDVVINVAEAGTIAIGGTAGCDSSETAVASGSNTITLDSNGAGGNMNDGAYTCTVTFTDSAGNAASALTLTAFTIDATANAATETTAVSTPGKDTTPDVVINVDESGTIAVGGSCGTSSSSSVSSGDNTITLTQGDGSSVLADGTYNDCTVTFTDALGTAAAALTLTTFVVDTTVAAATETTAVSTPNKDQTPDVVINVAEAGTIAVGGTSGCDSSETAVASGANTITLDSNGAGGNMAEGTYTCTITFTDSAGNAASALTLTAFTIDVTVAAATETTAVTTPTNDQTPDVVINVAEAGTIAVGGTAGCDSSETAVASGANTITLDANGAGGNMAAGAYTCTITFTDSAGNAAAALTLTAFTVDVSANAATETTAVTTPTADTTPDVVISVAEAGTIAVGGTSGCGLSSTSDMSSGANTVTLTASGGDAAYTCTITFTDDAGNAAAALTLTAFTLDTTAAAATET
ncbi:MAG: hypothetical protein CMA93_05580, partial [Euryarchaeota archaeon]|nr:hypothetical protein [Euryarchaeota archaeon]